MQLQMKLLHQELTGVCPSLFETDTRVHLDTAWGLQNHVLKATRLREVIPPRMERIEPYS